MLHSDLQDRLDAYLVMWQQSPAASRVDAVEGFAINHGFPQYEDQTIPEILTFILNDLLVFLAQNPGLLEGVLPGESDADKVNRFLAEEQAKIDEAGDLVQQMKKYWLGPLDPRYRKARARYHDVVQSFRIG